ncbi:ly6/PLAUR domain-containing protein 1 isoform X1 [Rattus norvegicus]
MERPAAWPDTLMPSRHASLLLAPARPAVVLAALGLPSGSLLLETETQGARLGRSPSPALQESGERQIGATPGCSCVGYTVGDTELGVRRVLELGETGKGGTSLQPSQVIKCLWPPKGAATLTGLALQIQCYQCEEFQLNNDCSSPEFIVNCTVNVQDMCQKEVMEQSAGIMYRKSCASSAACLIASAGYQSFCSPGKLNSVCISCCNTPLCNGPRPKKRGSSASAIRPELFTTVLFFNLALCLAHC